MSIRKKVFVLFCVIFIANSGAKPTDINDEDNVKLVHILFRHGDRNPSASYQNDPWKNYPWPDGYAALTLKGKGQLYKLGQTFHSKYDFFFKNSSTNTIYARSSDADRCHMSGLSFLAGFYPPEKHQNWNPNLDWQPIPLHSLPSNLDNLITVTKDCPAYSKALYQTYNTQEMKDFNEKHKDLYEYLTIMTGQPVNDINDVEFLYYILEIEEQKGLKLPEWTKNVYPDRMKEIAIKNLEIFTATEYMKKIKGGPILTDMIQNMQSKLQNTLNPDRNVFVYSAHDITLINVMRTIGLQVHMKPDYAAAFVLEAHAPRTSAYSDFEIKMLYYNSSITTDPYEFKLDACGSPCYLKKFMEVTKNVLVENWDKECQIFN